MSPTRNPTEHAMADMYMVGILGKASRRMVLTVDKSATPEPTPSTAIMRKNSTAKSCRIFQVVSFIIIISYKT
jgi:hypothetical protein